MKKETIAIALIIIMAIATTAHYYSLDKLVMIQSEIDQQDANWTAGITSVSHLSAEEKKRMCGARIAPLPDDAVIVSRPQPYGVAAPADPPSFDWRDVYGTNWMTPVKSQGGNCGSCWAFAALGVLEAVANIEANNSNIDLDLSEQYWVSDCYRYGDCDGGWPDHVFDRIRMYGAPLEECDEYIAANSPCVCTGWYPDGVYYSIERRRYITSSTEDLKWALQEYGPLVVTLNVPEDWFYYRSGIYEPVWTSDEFGANGDHAVVLVGWDDAEECWFIKNSYGAGWGEDGYARVLYGNLEKYDYVYTVDGVEYPEPTPLGAQIDDDTDTLTTDKSSYSLGDVVYMTATGTNIGDESWQGRIFFYSISPSGYTKQVYLYTITVAAGSTESRTGTMTLPLDAEAGIWTVRSIWIDDDGVVHARSTIPI